MRAETVVLERRITNFAEITQSNGHCAVQSLYVFQGHRFWYQSKAHVRLLISD